MKFDKIGVLGGGQLGMFLCMSAKKLGKEVVIYSESKEFSAKNFSSKFFIGKYTDFAKINEFLNTVDLVTVETENIPLETLQYIEKKKKLLPGSFAIEKAQNREKEKRFLNSIAGIKTTNFTKINCYPDLLVALNDFKDQVIIKSCEQGYDGKNQFFINTKNKGDFKYFALKGFIAEKVVKFIKEISVIICRDTQGNVINYPPVENNHKDNILFETIYPANITDKIKTKAINHAKKIISSLDMVGLLAVEMFVLEKNELIINEIAPRPHNSGHWTIDCCDINQFDSLLLSICGEKIKRPKINIKGCQMVNIIGKNYNNRSKFKDYKFYDYYKDKIQPKRKMGHLLRKF